MDYMNLLPWHIFEKVYYEAINIDECDLRYNRNLRLVSKYWNKLIPEKKFWKLYSKKIILKNQNNYSSIFDYVNKLIKDNNKILKNIESESEKRELIISNNLFKKVCENEYFIVKTHKDRKSVV